MPRKQIRLFEGELATLQLSPGDILVLMMPRRMHDDELEHVRRVFAEKLPGHPCVILEDGATLGVLKKDSGGEDPPHV